MKFLFCGLLFSFSLSALVQAAVAKSALEGRDLRTGKFLEWEGQGHKVKVVLFLSIHCPNSQAHLEEIKKLAEKNSEFAFVGVHSNADESESQSMVYFKKHPLPFPVLQDENSQIADQFKALKTPHVFVLSEDGKILYQGGVTDSADPAKAQSFYLQEALKDLKNGKPVRTPEGRTLGCRILRAKEKKNEW